MDEKDPGELFGEKIKLHAAPSPSEILWEN